MASILIVDYEADACRLMQRILSLLGHDVQAFTNAAQALEWLRANVPELVIVDFKLDGGNAVSVVESIRRNQPGAKVMVLAASSAAETSARAVQLGIDEYLIKPLEIDEFEQRVNRVLGEGS